jgi:GNAT superfamily N-acetyltransferase
MTYHIRTGNKSDAIACVDILRTWAAETPWMAELDDLKPMQDFWIDIFEHDLVWVAEGQGRILGFCTRGIEDVPDNIGALYVVSELRSSGIGRRLLDKAKENRDWITVWAYEKNVDALRFYKREGLVEVSREVEEGSNLMNIEHRWVRAE